MIDQADILSLLSPFLKIIKDYKLANLIKFTLQEEARWNIRIIASFCQGFMLFFALLLLFFPKFEIFLWYLKRLIL